MSTARKVPSPDSKQHDLFGEVRVQDARPRPNASETGRRFVTGNPHEIVLGTARLEDYRSRPDQRAPFVVAHLLGQQDWLPFEQRYAATGRTPFVLAHNLSPAVALLAALFTCVYVVWRRLGDAVNNFPERARQSAGLRHRSYLHPEFMR